MNNGGDAAEQGNDTSNGFFLSGPEASGRGVRRVAQLRDSPVDLLLGRAGDVAG